MAFTGGALAGGPPRRDSVLWDTDAVRYLSNANREPPLCSPSPGVPSWRLSGIQDVALPPRPWAFGDVAPPSEHEQRAGA
eukprot:821414-Pyramimonas_sp.AAC.1